MAIKNYTTTIQPEKTVAEIQKMLVRHGARQILTDYDAAGLLCAVSFKITTPSGAVSFRLPANVDGVLECLKRDAPRSLRTRAQATRVGWRIVKDWVAAQLAIVESEMVNVVQVFMPYAIGPGGQTIGEELMSNPEQFLRIEG